ncbi:MAG TPA: tetratricopeptide repeat protein [Chthoniobacterales bacterium]
MSRSHRRLCAATLFLAVFLVFLPCAWNGFVNFDDPVYVLSNSQIQHGFTGESLRWAFSSGYAANWHPLTWLCLMLDWKFLGLHAWGYHLVSVVLHATNALLLFLVLRRATGAFWRSLFVAALFGLHPLRVESVAWMAELKDVLSTLFWILTMWAYVEYARKPEAERARRRTFYLWALGFFILGLLSKPMLVTLPFVFLLLDWWPLQRFSRPLEIRRFLLEKLPFFILSAAVCLITWLVQKSGGAMEAGVHTGWWLRLANAGISYWRYLGKLFFPVDLAVYYPLPPQPWPLWLVLLAMAALILVSYFAVTQGRRRPYLLTGWLWYLGTAVPVIGLVLVGDQAMADRYTYVPMIGVAIALAWGMADLTRAWRKQRAVLSVVALLLLAGCALLSIRQIAYWKNSETLFRHDLASTGPNPTAHLNLATALAAEGRDDEAIPEFQTVLQLSRNESRAHFGLGVSLLKKHEIVAALSQLEAGTAGLPQDANGRYALGLVYERMDDWPAAEEQFREATKLNPDFAQGYEELGVAFRHLGNWGEAVASYRKALGIDPHFTEAHKNLGAALAFAKEWREAAAELREVLKENPNSAEVHNILGIVYENMGELKEAVAQYREAVRLKPDYTEAQNNLAAALRASRSHPQP